MKPHLSFSLWALISSSVLVSATALGDTANIDNTEYTFGSLQVRSDGAIGTETTDATWLGGGARYGITDGASLGNAGTIIIATGTATVGDGSPADVQGGQLFLDGWGSSAGVRIANNLILGATSYNESGYSATLRFGGDGGSSKKAVLDGVVTLAADSVIAVGGTENYINGNIAGSGQKLTFNRAGTMNLSGGATLGELQIADGNGILNLNNVNSDGTAVSSLEYTIGVKSGGGRLNVASGVTLNLGSQTGGSIDAAAGSTINYSGSSFSGSLSGSTHFVKQGTSALAVGGTFSVGSLTVESGSMTLQSGASVSQEIYIAGSGKLIVDAGVSLVPTAIANAGTLELGGDLTLGDGSSLGGSVLWTGGTLTLNATDQYAATSTTISSGAGHIVLNLSGGLTAESTLHYDLGMLSITGGTLTFSLTGADTSLFDAANFTVGLASDMAQGADLVGDSLFLNLNNDIYQGVLNGTTITFQNIGVLPLDGTADAALSYKFSGGGTLSADTSVMNLFIQAGAEGAATSIDMGTHTLSVSNTLTFEADAQIVNGTLTTQDVKLASGTATLGDGTADTTMTVTGSISGAGTLAVNQNATLELQNTAVASQLTGSGTVKINWGTASGNVNSSLTGFTGTLQIAGGRYEGGSTTLGASSIVVTEGGQFHLTGGTWNQSLTLSGEGWRDAGGALNKGALAMDGGTLSGSVSLSGNASLHVAEGKTGTISGTIAGNNHMLTKEGAGNLALSNGGNTDLRLTIAEGTVTLSNQANYNLTSLTVKDHGTLRLSWNSRFTIDSAIFEDGSTLDLNDCGSTSHHTMTFTEMTVKGTAKIKNQTNGYIYIAGKITGDSGTMYFTAGSGDSQIILNSEMSGTLNITKDVNSILEIANANNTFSGNTSVSAGEIKVSGAINSADNTYAATGNGLLSVAGENGKIQNSAVTVRRNGSTDASIRNATVGTTSIARETGKTQGTLAHASIDVVATAYAIEGMAMSDSLVNIKAAGSLTLDNVTLSGTSAIVGDANVAGTKTVIFSGNGNKLAMPAGATGTGHDTFDTGAATLTSVYVYDISAHFSDVTLTGHLAIDVSALLGTLPGSYEYIAFDFGTDNNVVLDENLTASVTPNAYSSDELAGTVSGHVVYFKTNQIPEPASAGLALLGMAGLLLRRRRRA